VGLRIYIETHAKNSKRTCGENRIFGKMAFQGRVIFGHWLERRQTGKK